MAREERVQGLTHLDPTGVAAEQVMRVLQVLQAGEASFAGDI